MEQCTKTQDEKIHKAYQLLFVFIVLYHLFLIPQRCFQTFLSLLESLEGFDGIIISILLIHILITFYSFRLRS